MYICKYTYAKYIYLYIYIHINVYFINISKYIICKNKYTYTYFLELSFLKHRKDSDVLPYFSSLIM